MMSIGHGAAGPPTQLTGGAALGKVKFTDSQAKLKELEKKRAEKKVEAPTTATQEQDQEKKPLPTNEEEPLDWDTLIGEKINRFSQLLRSDIVRLKLQKIREKLK